MSSDNPQSAIRIPQSELGSAIERQSAHPGGRILVVDDEEKNRRILADLLSAEGYTVRTAVDGVEALRTTTAFQPEAILLDIMMPELDGVEACRRLKSDPATASIPILLVTALHERADRLKGIRAGADDFMTKPLDTDEIRLRVKNAVRAKRLYDQIRDAYAQLQQLQELRDNLTQFIVHDLRSPFSSIMGNLELLQLEYLGTLSEKQRRCVDDALSVARQLLEMISSLLDVSRLERAQMPIRLKSCDLRRIVQQALDTLGSLLAEIEVTVDAPPDLPDVVCDEDIIQRVLTNLIGNAIKAMASGGAIRIGIATTANGAEVSVADTGMGIPPDHLDRIFEKFGQVETRSGAAKYSTGLGLTFCKLAIEAHGGSIGVESRLGQGSTFRFVLPARDLNYTGSKTEGGGHDGTQGTNTVGG